ncbi:MAG: hypothetical protein IJ657_00180 [Acidaminococcaceae bacterium]|nr:hypothetical protein [Acidaminococcaceae bacterium]
MRTYKITVTYKKNGAVISRALFMVEEKSEEAAKKKLEAALKDEPPHEITEVKENATR